MRKIWDFRKFKKNKKKGDTGKKKLLPAARLFFSKSECKRRKSVYKKKKVTVMAVHHENRRISQCGMGVRLPYKNLQSTLCSNIAFYTKNDPILDLLTSIIHKCCIIIQFEFVEANLVWKQFSPIITYLIFYGENKWVSQKAARITTTLDYIIAFTVWQETKRI